MTTRYNFFGGLVTDGLIVNADASKLASYPAGGTGWIDISGQRNNASLINGPTFSGISKGATINFDGTNDHCIFGDIQYNRTTFSVSIWCNFPVYHTGWISTINKWFTGGSNGANNEWSLSPDLSSGPSPWAVVVQYAAGGSSVLYIADTVNYKTNTWYNASFTWERGALKLYINGVQKASGTTPNTSAQTTVQPFAIASFFNFSNYMNRVNVGSAQMYNKALSAFEIWQNWNAYRSRYGVPDIVTSGLVMNLAAGNPYSYHSPTSGTTWTDVSGNGNNGTLTNGPAYSGGSITFDGADDYARVPYNASLNPDTITVNAWINRSQAVNYAHFIGLPSNNSTWGPPYMSYGVEYISTSDTISFVLGFTDNSFAYTNFALSFGNNQWFNFTATYDKTNVKIYINGVLSVTRAETKTMYQSTADFYLGAINTSSQYPLNGKIANVQVYNRALSATEVQQNFEAFRGRYGL